MTRMTQVPQWFADAMRKHYAEAFVLAFEAVALVRGRDAALRDITVQAARFRYVHACAQIRQLGLAA